MSRKEVTNELCKLLYSEDFMCDDTQKGRYRQALKIAISSLEIDEQYELLCEQIEPYGKQVDFPNTFDEFCKQRQIADNEKIYSNGIEFIPTFRVKQWLEHIENRQII